MRSVSVTNTEKHTNRLIHEVKWFLSSKCCEWLNRWEACEWCNRRMMRPINHFGIWSVLALRSYTNQSSLLHFSKTLPSRNGHSIASCITQTTHAMWVSAISLKATSSFSLKIHYGFALTKQTSASANNFNSVWSSVCDCHQPYCKGWIMHVSALLSIRFSWAFPHIFINST